MDRKFYTDGFEQMLTEKTDEFKMYPSKKAWHGIYNDLHPGRTWPSIATCIMLVSALLVVSELNTHNPTIKTLSFQPSNLSTVKKTAKHSRKSNALPGLQNDELTNGSDGSEGSQEPEGETAIANIYNFNSNFGSSPARVNATLAPIRNINSASLLRNANLENGPFITKAPITNQAKANFTTGILPVSPSVNDVAIPNGIANNQSIETIPDGSKTISTTAVTDDLSSKHSSNNIHGVPDANVSSPLISSGNIHDYNYSAINLHSRLRKNKLSWQFYASPSFSYRRITNASRQLRLQSLVNANAQINSFDREADEKPSLGLEVGGSLLFQLAKNLQLKAGLQGNYTNYHIEAFSIHPVMSTLLLTSEATGSTYAVTDLAHYANGYGSNPTRLHNYSVQLSLPVGLEYRLLGNNKMHWDIAGSLAPTYALASNAYFLSTDMRSFIKQPSLIRKWNMATEIGSFLTFKTNSFNWQIGPQLRYQILSSYNNNYGVSEHFVDYGIKFGVTRLLK